MNYELAKELKEAGFPKKGVKEPYCITCADWAKTPLICLNRKHEREFIKVPTLSELIEACGEEFYSVVRVSPAVWKAFSTVDGENFICTSKECETPEEAVTRLYLALNKK